MWLNFREKSFYSNKYASLKHEILVNSYNISFDRVNCNLSANSVRANLISIFSSCTRYLKLDRNLCRNNLLRINLGRSIGFFITRHEEKERIRQEKLEAKVIRHSNDLLSVLRQWIRLFSTSWLDVTIREGDSIKTLSDLEKWEPFSWACEHLEDKYHAIWEAWFGKEKGKEGYTTLVSQIDEQIGSIRKGIGDKIKDTLTPYEQFNDNEVAQLIEFIYEYIESRVDKGHDSYYFGIIETTESRPAHIASLHLPKEPRVYSCEFFGLTASSARDLVKTVETLNSVLSDAELNGAMKNLKRLRIERNRKQEQFITGIKYIITAATYEFKGIEGKCRVCRDWKP